MFLLNQFFLKYDIFGSVAPNAYEMVVVMVRTGLVSSLTIPERNLSDDPFLLKKKEFSIYGGSVDCDSHLLKGHFQI
jgi:hypothetical protein